MLQTASLPKIFQVNEGNLHRVSFFLRSNSISFEKALIVSGSKRSSEYADIIEASFSACERFIVKENNFDTINELSAFCKIRRIDLLIGVGGGSVLDVVKRVSLLTDIGNLLVPTIISNDGLMSPIAVIKDSNGATQSMPGRMPFGIVVDLNVLRTAPVKYLQAAAGDLLSNISATNDWSLASEYNEGSINDLAYMLSRNAAFTLIHHESKDLNHSNFVKQLVHSQINSGLAMSLAGTSRPCSGSEHLISHAVDFLKLSDNTLHGLQVGSISIFCLYLQKKLDVKCINYAFELNIPLAFHQLDPQILPRMDELSELSFQMRPGRFTVLDTVRGMRLSDLYENFLGFLDRFKVLDSNYKYY